MKKFKTKPPVIRKNKIVLRRDMENLDARLAENNEESEKEREM